MVSDNSYPDTLETAGDWTNEAGFLGADDDDCATVAAKNEVSGEMSYGFTAVTGTIDGLLVSLRGYVAGPSPNDVFLVELYDSTSTWVGRTTTSPGTNSCASPGTVNPGGSTDLWGGTWTAAHIKSDNFRIRITSKAVGASGTIWGIDTLRTYVWYSAVTESIIVID